MAVRYVRSTDGSNADGGTTWALAKADLTGIAAIDTAGDTIWMSQVHAESSASAQTWAFAGTLTSPVKIYCGNDAAEPPTALAATGSVTNTLASGTSFTITGNCYFLNVAFSFTAIMACGNSAAQEKQTFDSCAFTFAGGGSGCQFLQTAQNQGGCEVVKKDCTFTFANAANFIQYTGRMTISGGSFLAGTTTNTTGVFHPGSGGRSGELMVENHDFSQFGTGLVLVNTTGGNGIVKIRNCKLPASWVGTLTNAAVAVPDFRVEMHNCDSTDTNYRIWTESYGGSVKSETTIVKTSGASDGTTALSWKMVSGTAVNYPMTVLESPEIVLWNDTTGSSKTLTIDIVRDSVTNLKDNEIWIEVNYLGTSGFPLGVRSSDCVASVVTTAADQASSSATWTTTGLTNPNKQAVGVTFTPQKKGYYHAKVLLAKASTTVYVDPFITVT